MALPPSTCRVYMSHDGKSLYHTLARVVWWALLAGTILVSGANGYLKSNPTLFSDPVFRDRHPEPILSAVWIGVKWAWVVLTVNWLLERLHRWLKERAARVGQYALAKKVVDHFHERTAPEDSTSADYRVTLYRYRQDGKMRLACRGLVRIFAKAAKKKRSPQIPWSGYLEAYSRSKSFSCKRKSRWRVSLDRPAKNEGFAGLVFGRGASAYLDDQELLDASSSGKKRRTYCSETNTPSAWLERRLKDHDSEPPPRSFWGAPLEIDPHEPPWGVLLVDSALPSIQGKEILDREAELVLRMLKLIVSSRHPS